ncbi:MAG: class I SAM-dependent methyltransferase [Planctomycetota bacterium]|jgi:SAM-dependent methyltransferase|nr:class I SAM-dependent methyltransferase [Planctomycetota bacterium]
MSIASRISAANRKRKYEHFLAAFPLSESTAILDVGYSNKEYSDSENYLERHYPYPKNITALGVTEPGEFAERYPDVKTVVYDGTVFPFADKQFDVCWSNAVIEHVGDRDRQILLLREIRRVSRAAYITTPNRCFPFEVHTKFPLLHWLPKPWFDHALRMLGKEWAAGDFMHLLSLREIKALLAEAGIEACTIAKNRFCGFAMDFSISMRF